ncbi:MAG TPA: DUF1800 family protein, partial [Humisphaera sp.]|nr:DUF1800 family protein [Humisphaera sp.]
MISSRGVSRLFGAAIVAVGFCLGSVAISRGDDNQAPPRHVKTLQERILEVQAGANLLEKKAPKTLAGPDLSDREKVVQVLNRMAFGPTPGQVDEVLEMGLSRYIKEQLDPEKIDDSECEKTVAARYPWMKLTMAQMDEEYGYQRGPNKKKNREGDDSMHSQFPTLIITRSVLSKRQFKEVMCEFWRNHFCVDQPRVNEEKSRTATDPDYEENVIRKHVFGNFKDMLFASARHPAMLEYLDNKLSKRNEWNENYAREVMELHTVGADRGYSNLDVQELSKVLTGWGYDDNFQFHFSPERHQPGPKHWLGMTIPEGYQGGEEALYMLSIHPNTATFIA